MVYNSIYNYFYFIHSFFVYFDKCNIKFINISSYIENEFHAKATKKAKGSKTSIKLIRNSSRVANICADVIGDICGVLSGAIAALISLKIAQSFSLEFDIQFLISAIVASITVSGKALGKGIAKRHSTEIVHIVGKIIGK